MEVSKRNLFKHKKCPLARISSHLSKWLFFSFDNPMTVKASLIKILTIFLFTLVSRHTRKALVHHLIKLLSTNLVPDVFFSTQKGAWSLYWKDSQLENILVTDSSDKFVSISWSQNFLFISALSVLTGILWGPVQFS